MEFDGEFETHITVQVDALRVDALRTWAIHRQVKFLHIVLDRGDTPSQPMLTRRDVGTLSHQVKAANTMTRSLESEGFVVVRVKIEAAISNRDIPQADDEAARQRPGRYFEHHVKLVLDAGADVGALAKVAGGHAAQLSRNVLRDREDGMRERFVTQRCQSVGRATARRHLDELLASLMKAGYETLDVEEEYVVHDSNLAIDAGWIDAGDG
jgi:hypothetical protein